MLGTPSHVLAADAPQQFSIEAVHIDDPPKIDGTLDDPLWQKAAHVQLTWDYSYQRPASETTDAYVLVDPKYIYVAFVAQQAEPVTTTLHNNNVTLAADDVVRIYLWPGGDHGFEYVFAATPIGTRNQISTENSAFTPTWTAVGKATQTGYVVTMQIPLNVMRGDGRKTWGLQFDRGLRSKNQTFEWSHTPSQQSTDDTTGIGHLEGIAVAATSTRTKPRLSIYALGQAGAPSAGGSTSRIGADFALPITPTASFFGTLHPDYSNVELDQQTISPTAFPRQFLEVRPFFTQGANFYNNFHCNDCISFPLLYTPAIPTPRDGFAVEGVQGLAQFAGFDAMRTGRSDAAETFRYSTADHRYGVIAQHQSVTTPDFIDNATIAQVYAGNAHNFSVYFTLGQDRGTNVTDPKLGGYGDYGLNLYTPKSGIFVAYHRVGAFFAPADAFVNLTDVEGPSAFTFKEFDFSPTSFIQRITLSQDYQHYHNRLGVPDFANDSSGLSISTRNQFGLNVTTGNSFLLLGDGSTALINQNGVGLSYGSQTSLPSSVTYNVGRFASGYLISTTSATTFRAGIRGSLTLEADGTHYLPDAGSEEVQWLERASYAYQLSSDSSVAVGVRRIIGTAPPLTPAPRVVNAGNVTFAFYRKAGPNEIYLVYGDPNSLATKPALVLKLIHYFGAEKGA